MKPFNGKETYITLGNQALLKQTKKQKINSGFFVWFQAKNLYYIMKISEGNTHQAKGMGHNPCYNFTNMNQMLQ